MLSMSAMATGPAVQKRKAWNEKEMADIDVGGGAWKGALRAQGAQGTHMLNVMEGLLREACESQWGKK